MYNSREKTNDSANRHLRDHPTLTDPKILLANGDYAAIAIDTLWVASLD